MMVNLTKHLTVIQVTTIILSHVILKSDAGIAGLIASAALMAMFRPKVIPVPIPLPLPVPVPVPFKGKSPFNIFNSHREKSTAPNFPNHSYYLNYPHPYHHHHPSMIPSSPLAFPYLHPGYPPMGHSMFPPPPPPPPSLHLPPPPPPLLHPSPNYSPFSPIHGQQLMSTNHLPQKMILPYGLLPHPASAYHHINQKLYGPVSYIDQNNLYSHGTINPSSYYSGPFVIYI